MRTPIVVVAYNRPRSLTRLLGSISKANYPHTNIPLIISIDKAENNQNVLEVATSFNWEYGDKKVVYQAENLGLRRHIIQCGGLSQEYGAVIVLEDDLFVSPNFYVYTEQALEFSLREPAIGGVSLYNHQLNVHTLRNFHPIADGFENWYFQFASSWGQAWTKEQWKRFMDWYDVEHDLNNNDSIPKYVRSWSEKSWLKYNIAYLIEKDLFFLYPQLSLTTNFSDAGTHVGNDSTIFQVPLDNGTIKKKYHFSSIEESQAIYDAFFENLRIPAALGLLKEEVAIDLYGYKPKESKRYILTPKILNYKIVRSFGKSLKPHDDNIFNNVGGWDFFLYDTLISKRNGLKANFVRNAEYNFKLIPFDVVSKLFINLIFTRFGNLLRKIFKT